METKLPHFLQSTAYEILKIVVPDKSVSFGMSAIVDVSTFAKRCYTRNQYMKRRLQQLDWISTTLVVLLQ